MGDQEIRLECLRLAQKESPYEAVSIAQNFYDFVTGTNDAEVLRAARDLAYKIKQT